MRRCTTGTASSCMPLVMLTQSIDEFRRAREHGPFETTVALDGAIALYSARRYDDARSEVIRGLALDSTRPDLVWFQGLIQLAQGRADSAVSSFETARSMRIGFVDIRAYLSVAHRALGDLRDADAEYAAVRRDYTAGRDRRLRPRGGRGRRRRFGDGAGSSRAHGAAPRHAGHGGESSMRPALRSVAIQPALRAVARERGDAV